MRAVGLWCLLCLAAGGARAETLEPADLGRATFQEEFEELRLRPAEPRGWTPRFWWVERYHPDGLGFPSPNRELQWYVNPAHAATAELNPFTVADGVLSIVAAPLSPPWRAALGTANYSSGLLSTFGSFSQRYGYFEVRAQMPRGRGLWPAIWLLPDDGGKAEIDAVEVLGDDPGRAYHTVHSYAEGVDSACHGVSETADLADGFHLYGVNWQPDRIRFYVDRVLVFACPTPSDMHTPHYVILNLAVGGWAGPPDATTPFPARLLIDYVRVYEGKP